MARKNRIDETSALELAQTFRLLGDRTRLRIMLCLARKEMGVRALSKALNLNQQVISHHLGYLRMGRLVTKRRTGMRSIYSLNAANLADQLGRFARALPDT